MVEFAKIPAKLNTTDKRQVKALAVYFALKQFYYNGQLDHFKKRRKFFAKQLNISVSCLRYKETELLKHNLATWDGSTLKLTSYIQTWQILNIKSKRFVKVQSTDVHFLEKFLYSVAIKENLKRQQYEIDQKITAAEILNTRAASQMGFIDADYTALVKKASQRAGDRAFNKMVKRLMKAQGEKIRQRYISTWYQYLSATVEQPGINPIATLSCSGIARVCLGKSYNPSTGYYLAKWLEFYGCIKIRGEQIRIDRKLTHQARLYEPIGITGKHRTLSNRITVEF